MPEPLNEERLNEIRERDQQQTIFCAVLDRSELLAEVTELRATLTTTRAAALLEAADVLAAKDHRLDLSTDPHSVGWRQALNEAEHDLRQKALSILDELEGIDR